MKVICDAAQDGRCPTGQTQWCHGYAHTPVENICDGRAECPAVIGPVKCVPVEDDNG